MRRTILVDVETVVDADMARRVAGDKDLTDEDAMSLVAPRRADGSEAFPKPLYHRVVEIAVCVLNGDGSVGTLKALSQSTDERELLRGFWAGLASHTGGARLVTFNGRRFDLPVLVHRALVNGVSPGPWWTGDYRHRYRDGHIDLMDFLSDFGASTVLSQHEMAAMLGVPGKLGVSGEDVRALWAAGRTADIAAYCACDVATLTLCFARVGVHAGWCTKEEVERIETGVRKTLEELAVVHSTYEAFLEALS
jgi:predicted PolB exonuclease-like 3'-5' exonuclease